MVATLLAAGAEGVEMPDLPSLRRSFDDDLEAPFHLSVEDPERVELLVALGLRRAG